MTAPLPSVDELIYRIAEYAEGFEREYYANENRMQVIGAYIRMLHAAAVEGQADKARLDWLADKENTIGNVQLPTECVMDNLHSLRGAIDAAMQQENKS